MVCRMEKWLSLAGVVVLAFSPSAFAEVFGIPPAPPAVEVPAFANCEFFGYYPTQWRQWPPGKPQCRIVPTAVLPTAPLPAVKPPVLPTPRELESSRATFRRDTGMIPVDTGP